MIPTNSLHQRLRQPFIPDGLTPIVTRSEYIELPEGNISTYKDLKNNPLFPSIQTQFLKDLNDLKVLSRFYVGYKFDDGLAIFLDKIENPSAQIRDSLVLLYHDTRYQIYRLVQKLHQCNKANSQNTLPIEQLITKDQLSLILEGCLTNIDLCSAGVHSRFVNVITTLETTESGLTGSLLKIKASLYKSFIEKFMFELQRQRTLTISEGLEIHWFNTFYNLYCDYLGFDVITDRFTQTNLSQSVIKSFLSTAPLLISDCRILREMAEKWIQKIIMTLTEERATSWLTENIDINDITGDQLQALNNNIFTPLNILFEAKENLGMAVLLEDNKSDDFFCFTRFQEKLLGWITQSLLEDEKPTVFSPISCRQENKQYIGNMADIFFWIFDSDQETSKDKVCRFENNNHISVTLHHLKDTELSSWPNITCFALLTQALAQTSSAEEVADFFLDPFISGQLQKLEPTITEELSHILNNKMIRNTEFEAALRQHVTSNLISKNSSQPVIKNTLNWMRNTSLFEFVLHCLKKENQDISLLISSLTVWEASSFKEESLHSLLTINNLEDLFFEAFRFNKTKLLLSLLASNKIDHLLNCISNKNNTLLQLFSRSSEIGGVRYLLANQDRINVNNKNIYDETALSYACKNRHWEIVSLLLQFKGIKVNSNNYDSYTPLTLACKNGDLACIKELMKCSKIKINKPDNATRTGLGIAAISGYSQCIKELLKSQNIDVNINTSKSGKNALHIAAKKGHVQCINELLKKSNIKVNQRSSSHLTALHYASNNGHFPCLTLIMSHSNIKVNKTDFFGKTALMHAIKHKQINCIRLLLDHPDIDVSHVSLTFTSALTEARKQNLEELVKELEEIILKNKLTTRSLRFIRRQ